MMLISDMGNTSACAEKRENSPDEPTGYRKYLRVCGEEWLIFARRQSRMEIPPRVRRRASFANHHTLPAGNTSACAEKRPWLIKNNGRWRKYLRVCGEESPVL